MYIFFSSISIAMGGLLILPERIEGHGHMYSPRSRNWYSYEEGTDNGLSGADGVPLRDHCYYCLNTKAANEVCGVGNAQSYDNWLDVVGNPMPWNSQATYTEGSIIEIKSHLHTPHWGHQDVMICPDGDASTQECFEAHPLEFIEDVTYGAPKDPNNPNRGHFTGSQVDFTMKFELPVGVSGDKVLMQWRYVTANNCWPPGYENYDYDDAKGGNSKECIYPLDPTGQTGTGKPEQFWNCAEITILPNGPVAPTVTSPTPLTSTPPPVPAPTPTEPSCCSWPPFEECSQLENTWCHQSQSNCESSCSGKWLGGGAPVAVPTKAPVLAPPSPVVPTPPSSPQPTNNNGGRGCCSINFKTCHHPENTFCWENEVNCRGPCGKFWLPTGEIDGCAAQWDSCSNDYDCCGPATCGSDGTCGADGWNYTPSPTPRAPVSSPTTPAPVPVTASPVTSSPTASPSTPPTQGKSPTVAPTLTPTAKPLICKKWCADNDADWSVKCKWSKCSGCTQCAPPQTSAPTSSITSEPTTSPVTTGPPTSNPSTAPTNAPALYPTSTDSPTSTTDSDSCCTWDLYHCAVDDWCNASEENCHAACGGAWIKKNSAAMRCLAKYEQCTSDVGACCSSLLCNGNENYKQCI